MITLYFSIALPISANHPASFLQFCPFPGNESSNQALNGVTFLFQEVTRWRYIHSFPQYVNQFLKFFGIF